MISRADRFDAILGAEKQSLQVDDSDESAPASQFCEPAPAGMQFSPILGVAKFPYKYIDRTHGEIVATQFFNAGKFWEREWDLYYVWSPYFGSEKPIAFIPLEQFITLIEEIDHAIPSYKVDLPANSKHNGLVCDFSIDHPYLRPRFLGHSSSKGDFDRLVTLAPHFGPDSSATKPAKDSIDIFQDEMEAAMDAARNKGKTSKAKRQEARVTKQYDLGRQFERTQRMLGLTSPSTFEDDVIFVAVDIESYERNHKIITEIGIATVDTRNLHDKPPGQNGKDWHPLIRARHFRIYEHQDYRNYEFVHGCPENFEFGTSEFVRLKDAPKAVAACFKHPFSGPDTPDEETEKRNIVFVGHDTKQDVSYLRDLGYDPTNLSNLIEFQDTAAMYRAYSGQNQTRRLGHVLYELEFEAWHAHNAGNDAVYTVQAMLGLCVKAVDQKAEAVDDDGGGVSLFPDKSQQEDQEVAEATAKFVEWEM